MRAIRGVMLALLPFVWVGVSAMPAPAHREHSATELVSVDGTGAIGGSDSFGARVSANGRFVAFTSTAGLVSSDTNGVEDAYLRDRWSHTTRRISVDSETPPLFAGLNPVISDDGNVAAYLGHHATKFGPREAVFVRDLRRHTLTRVSPDDAFFCWNGGRNGPTLSADGSTVVFDCSRGTTSVTTPEQCFALNLRTGSRVTLPVCGFSLHVDAHGRKLALVQFSDEHVLVVDLRTLQARDLGPGELGCSISADGRRVAYSNFDGTFVRDLTDNALTRVDVSSTGTPADQQSNGPAISPDGRFVAFESSATNLVPNDTNASVDIFVHDLKTGSTKRVDLDETGSAPPGVFGSTAFDASVSAHARVVTFSATVPLVSRDTNGAVDVYAFVDHHRSPKRH